MFFWLPKNPKVALMLLPWFMPCDCMTAEDMCAKTYRLLRDKPEDTFVCLAIDEDRIKGMAVAYCRKNDVIVWQARSQGLASTIVDRAFEGICHWARGKGFNMVSALPNRAAKLWQRRWGFRQRPNSPEVFKEI